MLLAIVVGLATCQVTGVPRDRLAGLGPITSGALVTIRPHDGRRWKVAIPKSELEALDKSLRSHYEPVLGGGRSLPSVKLVVADGAGRTVSLFGSVHELHPGGDFPEAIVPYVARLESGTTEGWTPIDDL